MATSDLPNLLVIGSMNMDLVVRSGRIPQPGQTVLGGLFFQAPGGKGGNQAVAAARLGARTRMLAKVGDDGFGATLIAGLRDAGVDAGRVERIAGESTGVALIMVGADGENAISVASGANATADVAWIDRHEDLIAQAKVCLFQLEIPQETVAHAIAVCRHHGVLSILDTAPVSSEANPDLFKADVVSPNAGEAEQLTGIRPVAGDEETIRDVIGKLRDRGAERIVLKLGSDGAAAFEAGRFETVAPHRIDAVDTTAAGDAFTAALGVGLASGKSLLEATRYANAAGAAACTVLGAQPSMPSAATVRSLLAGP